MEKFLNVLVSLGKGSILAWKGDSNGKEHGYRSPCSTCETNFYKSFEAVELIFTGVNVIDFFKILQ